MKMRMILFMGLALFVTTLICGRGSDAEFLLDVPADVARAGELVNTAAASAGSIAAPEFISKAMSLIPPSWREWLGAFIAFIGAARLVGKPLSIALHHFCRQTRSSWDDELLARVENSVVMRQLAFLFDVILSVKLYRPAAGSFTVPLQSAGVVSRGPTENPGAAAAAMVTLAAALAFGAGCASNSQRQYDRSFDPCTGHLVREVETRVTARTLVEAKSELASFKASQTDKTQSISIGRQAIEANSTNTAAGLRELVELIKLLRAAP